MKEYLTQVVKDLMWSDPTPKEGTYESRTERHRLTQTHRQVTTQTHTDTDRHI